MKGSGQFRDISASVLDDIWTQWERAEGGGEDKFRPVTLWGSWRGDVHR